MHRQRSTETVSANLSTRRFSTCKTKTSRCTQKTIRYTPFEKGYMLNGHADGRVADLRTERQDGLAYKRQIIRVGAAVCFSTRPLSHRKDHLLLTVCQIIASFLIVTVSLLNLLLTDRDKALWSTLVGEGFGYLVPNLRLKRASSSSSHDEDESIHAVVAQQQLDGPLSEKHGVAMENETE